MDDPRIAECPSSCCLLVYGRWLLSTFRWTFWSLMEHEKTTAVQLPRSSLLVIAVVCLIVASALVLAMATEF
jgi:hypothetical protein